MSKFDIWLVVHHSHARFVSPTYSRNIYSIASIMEEEFEDTKGVIKIRISKKNRQHNDQKNLSDVLVASRILIG